VAAGVVLAVAREVEAAPFKASIAAAARRAALARAAAPAGVVAVAAEAVEVAVEVEVEDAAGKEVSGVRFRRRTDPSEALWRIRVSDCRVPSVEWRVSRKSEE
jgi:hypothetical protein